MLKTCTRHVLCFRIVILSIILVRLSLGQQMLNATVICCPRDCVSRHNGGTSGAPLNPLRDDSALRALSTLRGLRGAPEVERTARH